MADHRGIEPLLLDLESNVLPLTLMACGREDRIWTCGIYVPNVVFYQTELLPYLKWERNAPTIVIFLEVSFFPTKYWEWHENHIHPQFLYTHHPSQRDDYMNGETLQNPFSNQNHNDHLSMTYTISKGGFHSRELFSLTHSTVSIVCYWEVTVKSFFNNLSGTRNYLR